MMGRIIQQVIYNHAQSEYPREACGLLVVINGETVYRPCRNQADGTDHFILHPDDYAAADSDGDIVGIVHSHPNVEATPSQADRVACEASGLPWHIVSWPGMEWAQITPEGYQAPLIGRVWSHGVLDCYSIIRDWYKQERGITIPDFDRTDKWWERGENLYVENFQSAGFRRIIDEDPQPGDVLLMQVLANVPNHGAIYLGDEMMLHHLYSRVSCREMWGGYYKRNTTHILRYGP